MIDALKTAEGSVSGKIDLAKKTRHHVYIDAESGKVDAVK